MPQGVGHSIFPTMEYFGELKMGIFEGRGRLIKQKGLSYHGEFKNGEQEGEGVQKGKDFYYAGSFKKGMREGKGKLVSMDKDGIPDYEYEGEWKRDRRHGEGREQWWKASISQQAVMYEGSFKEDLREGKGRMYYKDGGKYIGDFYKNQRHGNGRMHSETLFCNGEWRNDKLHGKGRLEIVGKFIYEGEFKEGKLDGKGRQFMLRQDNKEVYEVYSGLFKKDMREGVGKCIKMCGYLYNGEWKGGVPHGTGLERRPLCCVEKREVLEQGIEEEMKKAASSKGEYQIYRGRLEKGLYEGQGTLSFLKGGQYTGQFKEGQFSGKGKLTRKDKVVFEGHWKENLPHGWLRKKYANGDIYEGEWMNGKQEGFGSFKWSNGLNYDGQWKGGKMNGNGRLMSKQESYSGLFENDEYAGPALLPKDFESTCAVNKHQGLEIKSSEQKWSKQYEVKEDEKFEDMLH